MSASDPSQTQPAPQQHRQQFDPRQSDYVLFKRYTAYGFLVVSPILIALPPRKLDLHTAALATAFLFSANYVTKERTGRGFVDHFASIKTPRMFRELPTERAEQVHQKLKEMKMLERADNKQSDQAVVLRGVEQGKHEGTTVGSVTKEIQKAGDTERWTERRAREEKEALEQGQGYSDLIIQYVKDAWGVDRTSKEDQQGNEQNKKEQGK
ncbi:hypothetical protein VTO42DRAFT_3060 [Malbranchea cinnamomea]